MARVTLIAGPTGAGKTTHARHICEQTGALRFSIDEWMAALFGADTPEPPTFDWAIARVERCEAQIWAVCVQALGAGVDVALDLGFTTRAQRERFRQLAVAQGAQSVLHYVTAQKSLRHSRVQRRNADHSETFAFAVTDAMFKFMEARLEVPDPAENAEIITTD
ncbi:MAG: AAA family ATPase [Alphaproteobacteria bacterium]